MGLAISIAAPLFVVALALWVMRRAWTTRNERPSAFIPVLPGFPVDAGAERTGLLPGIYVSTVLADNPLERVVGHGLGVRSLAAVQVFDAGVRILRTNSAELFVQRAWMRAVTTSGGQAGKFVGGEGLTVLEWRPPAVADVELPPLVRTAVRLRRAADRQTFASVAGALLEAEPGEKEKA